jgi:uncharacterized damage-inducible protein DinB
VTGDLGDRLLAHNEWANRTLLRRCRELPAQQFTQRFDIGPGNLHDTLLHVVGAMRRWADRIAGGEIRPSIEEGDRTWTPREIETLLDETARELAGVVRDVIDTDRLDESMSVTIRGIDAPFVFTRGTAIVHVVTHGVHHRAQALNMLRRLGVSDLPDLDAITPEVEAC